MAKRWITCPKCAASWQTGYWKWVFKTLFHFGPVILINPLRIRDIRWTKCPYCGKWSWMHREK